jgi:hypothetical protein
MCYGSNNKYFDLTPSVVFNNAEFYDFKLFQKSANNCDYDKIVFNNAEFYDFKLFQKSAKNCDYDKKSR